VPTEQAESNETTTSGDSTGDQPIRVLTDHHRSFILSCHIILCILSQLSSPALALCARMHSGRGPHSPCLLPVSPDSNPAPVCARETAGLTCRRDAVCRSRASSLRPRTTPRRHQSPRARPSTTLRTSPVRPPPSFSPLPCCEPGIYAPRTIAADAVGTLWWGRHGAGDEQRGGGGAGRRRRLRQRRGGR
jgi:hypothetical protein